MKNLTKQLTKMKEMKSKTKSKTKPAEKITKKMSFSQLMEMHPDSSDFLFEKGMHCMGCPMAMQESIGEGALAHGIDPDELVENLNKEINKKSAKSKKR